MLHTNDHIIKHEVGLPNLGEKLGSAQGGYTAFLSDGTPALLTVGWAGLDVEDPFQALRPGSSSAGYPSVRYPSLH